MKKKEINPRRRRVKDDLRKKTDQEENAVSNRPKQDKFGPAVTEHIGLLATVGLSQSLTHGDQEAKALSDANARVVAHALSTLLKNNAATGSPRLDGHAIDICLALFLLMLTDSHEQAKTWLKELAYRLNFTLGTGRLFPIGSDSLDDLVDFDVSGDEELKKSLQQTSWMFATIAAWCALLNLDQDYETLAKSLVNNYPEVGAQLWHPTAEWPSQWYFSRACDGHGETEAPYALPPQASELRSRISSFLEIERYKWAELSPTLPIGLWALDFVACRHFRTPVPSAAWYLIVKLPNGALPQAGDSE